MLFKFAFLSSCVFAPMYGFGYVYIFSISSPLACQPASLQAFMWCDHLLVANYRG
jgi:hypothetical protein